MPRLFVATTVACALSALCFAVRVYVLNFEMQSVIHNKQLLRTRGMRFRDS